jgi:protein O-GlcNAc transferase
VVPRDQQPYFTEKLVHLPGCYQINDSQREISPDTPSRVECSLPGGGGVFCCFNSSYKITPEVFGVWMSLLKAIPGSALWLLDGNRFAPPNLRREAEARGVPAERLVFAPKAPLPDHLARHRLADLFLDTFPVNAHTTASDALWGGCPVLTIAGQTFASRVAGSLLRAIGLPELITTSLEEYEGVALRLAREPRNLLALRERLAVNRQTSGLFDGARFARKVEKAYRTMWEIHSAGEAPAICGESRLNCLRIDQHSLQWQPWPRLSKRWRSAYSTTVQGGWSRRSRSTGRFWMPRRRTPTRCI